MFAFTRQGGAGGSEAPSPGPSVGSLSLTDFLLTFNQKDDSLKQRVLTVFDSVESLATANRKYVSKVCTQLWNFVCFAPNHCSSFFEWHPFVSLRGWRVSPKTLLKNSV
jgi:hypothetical protein